MSIQYCTQKARQTECTQLYLQERLDCLSKLTNLTETQVSELNSVRKELNELYQYKVDGALIRSRIRWHEEGERNSKYFLGLEKFNYQQKTLFKVEYNDKMIRSPSAILEAEVEYFSQLYSDQKLGDGNTYLDEIKIDKVLNEDQREMCDKVITPEECHKVLSNAKTGKSPGPDGLTFEFYKTFWTHLQHIMVRIFNYSLSDGRLSTSQGRAVISLLHKKGKKELLNNWRPISLLNTDYKILASVLADRLKLVLGSCISSDQNAYLKGRYIGNNVRLIDDVISYMQRHNKSGIILFLDLEKAFDKVNREFLYRVLEKFEFGDQFINYIKVLYSNAQSCIMNNNWQSVYFPLKRGLRQGCPISALLFLLVIEILAIDLKQCQDIKGIDLMGNTETVEVKISQFADDTTIFIADEQSLDIAMAKIDTFCFVAGPSLNMSKSKGFSFGNFNSNKFKDINWNDEFIKTLGVYFSKNMNAAYDKTWNDKVEKMESQLKQWRCRNLTYFGKVTVLKSLVISNITYIMSVFPTFANINKKIERLIYHFLWNGRDRIKRKTLIGTTDKGGINMPDFVLQSYALKAVWLQRLFDCETVCDNVATWMTIPRYYINSFGSNALVLKMSFEKECEFKQLQNLPVFYRQCIMAWKMCKSDFSPCLTAEDIRQQLLWGNGNIKNKKLCFFWKHWVSSNILVIGDIINEKGLFDINCIRLKLKKKGNYLCESKLIWNCIPKSWKEVLCKDRICYTNLAGQSLFHKISQKPVLALQLNSNVQGKMTRFIYRFLVDKCYITPNIEEYWNMFFRKELMWSTIWKEKITSVREFRLAQFNYKLLYKLHMSNKYLHRWKLVESSSCYKCNCLEDYYHLFYDCEYSSSFWKKFSKICYKLDIIQAEMKVEFKDIIVGKDGGSISKSLPFYND